MKSYCGQCKFHFTSYALDDDECHHEENKKYYDTYHSLQFRTIRHPKWINRKNDCPWFAPKECKNASEPLINAKNSP